MKQRMLLVLGLLVLFFPLTVVAEALESGLQDVLGQLDLQALEQASNGLPLLEGEPSQWLARLASGKVLLNPEGVLQWLLAEAAGVFRQTMWRMTRLWIPALLSAVGEQFFPENSGAGKAARYTGLLTVMGFLCADLKDYVQLCTQSVGDMSGWMQAIFPLLVTLLAAVGGTASSAFYQPAVMAAAGSMTTLIQHVTMPFAVGVAVLTMAGGLSDNVRLSRLCRLVRQIANWTLGFGFTVFIGVMSVQGLSAAAVDGVSIRTAKYAMDNFIPIVGGMFADTVDTLVGCSLLVENAVGVLGLLVLLLKLLTPLLRTVAALFLYRAASAVLQPVADSPLCRCIGEFGEVFSLLFIIELSVGAMFMLLCAEMLTVGTMTVMLR